MFSQAFTKEAGRRPCRTSEINEIGNLSVAADKSTEYRRSLFQDFT
jgi:hypothetical protein